MIDPDDYPNSSNPKLSGEHSDTIGGWVTVILLISIIIVFLFSTS